FASCPSSVSSFLFLRIRGRCRRPIPAGRRRCVALSGPLPGSRLVLPAGHSADGRAAGGGPGGRRIARDRVAGWRRRYGWGGRGLGRGGTGGAAGRRDGGLVPIATRNAGQYRGEGDGADGAPVCWVHVGSRRPCGRAYPRSWAGATSHRRASPVPSTAAPIRQSWVPPDPPDGKVRVISQEPGAIAPRSHVSSGPDFSLSHFRTGTS